MCRENVASHRLPCLKTSLMQTIDNGLGGNSSYSGIWLAVVVTVVNLSRRCINRMCRTWAGVVALSRPDLCLSLMLPVFVVTHPDPVNSGSANPHVYPCM